MCCFNVKKSSASMTYVKVLNFPSSSNLLKMVTRTNMAVNLHSMDKDSNSIDPISMLSKKRKKICLKIYFNIFNKHVAGLKYSFHIFPKFLFTSRYMVVFLHLYPQHVKFEVIYSTFQLRLQNCYLSLQLVDKISSLTVLSYGTSCKSLLLQHN